MSWFTVARTDPDTCALVDGPHSYTFGELRSIVGQICAGWDETGIARGETIAVVLRNRWELLAIELAALSTARYILPINHHLTVDEIAYILGDAEPALVVTSNEFLTGVDAAADIAGVSGATRVVTVDAGERAWTQTWTDRPDRDPADRRAGSLIFYSSGTTGRPKGIRRSLTGTTPEEESAKSRVAWSPMRLDRGPGVHVVIAPLYHAAPNGMVIGALARGVTVVIAPGQRFDAAQFLDFAGTVGMTESFLVPTMFSRLLNLPPEQRRRFDTSTVRRVIHAGAPCSIAVKQQMIDWWGSVLSEFYGSTECSVTTTTTSEEWLDAPGTVGRARPGYDIDICDDEGNPVPPGCEGLIRVAGSPEFDYIGDWAKTQQTRSNGKVVLGDIGRLDEHGRLFILDRRSDLILSGGVNIYPAEIELALQNHPEVQDVVVIGLPDHEWGQRVVALIQPADSADPGRLAQAVESYARDVLAGYKRPREYRITAAIPRMPTGKINRTQIREQMLNA
ncbi:AMP-binding protein [Rhodococcus erythropolis]|uniref:AMP-binding protein n=1 Tax=Rhodococcus erythropolis TaxID=1833 RepID=UPI00210B58CD|nr:AMP-binding protein [Rhodococcus erythropolis]MCQ4128286.1 AMP-binding protein [Rhodococcus erythropolis]